jgi:hypothetical protein
MSSRTRAFKARQRSFATTVFRYLFLTPIAAREIPNHLGGKLWHRSVHRPSPSRVVFALKQLLTVSVGSALYRCISTSLSMCRVKSLGHILPRGKSARSRASGPKRIGLTHSRRGVLADTAHGRARCPNAPGLTCVSLPQYASEQVDWIGLQRLSQRDEFRNSDLPLLAFDHPDHRVRSTNARCEVALGQPGVLASLRQDACNGSCGRSSEGLQARSE